MLATHNTLKPGSHFTKSVTYIAITVKYGIQESLRDCDSGAMVLQFGTINAQISCKRPVGIILWAQENHNLQYGSQETNYITHLLQKWSCGGHGTVFCYKSANMWYL